MSDRLESQQPQQTILENVNARDIQTGDICQILISIVKGEQPLQPEIIRFFRSDYAVLSGNIHDNKTLKLKLSKFPKP